MHFLLQLRLLKIASILRAGSFLLSSLLLIEIVDPGEFDRLPHPLGVLRLVCTEQAGSLAVRR